MSDVRLLAPCMWCGYNGPNYWQAGTHGEGCSWREVGGADERERRLRGLTGAMTATPAKPSDEERARAWCTEWKLPPHDRYAKSLAALLREVRAEAEKPWRLFAWLIHGHSQRLYGDDGEMQCGVFDFKRHDADRLLEHATTGIQEHTERVRAEASQEKDAEIAKAKDKLEAARRSVFGYELLRATEAERDVLKAQAMAAQYCPRCTVRGISETEFKLKAAEAERDRVLAEIEGLKAQCSQYHDLLGAAIKREGAAEAERDALRERVRVLEAECADLRGAVQMLDPLSTSELAPEKEE